MPYGIDTDYLRYEREVWREEIRRDREEAIRWFSPPPGFCPWGCGAADLTRNPPGAGWSFSGTSNPYLAGASSGRDNGGRRASATSTPVSETVR